MNTKAKFLTGASVLLAAMLAACQPPVTPPPTPTATTTATPTATPTPLAVMSACVDFEPPLTVGTQYGTPAGQAPGDAAFTASSGITVTVWEFIFTNGGNTFNLAEIDATPVPAGSGQSLHSNNLNLEFDFSQVGFETAHVDLVFLDLGGFENLSVNGSGVYAGELASAPSTLGGASLSVSADTLTLQGAITTLRVGGQEFWFDNLCARP